MSDAKLVRMANDIANFFKAYPAAEAASGIHDHMVAFWTPKMRRTLDALAGTDGNGLHPLVIDALRHTSLARSPAGKEAAGPGTVGEIGASDAG